MSEHQSANRNIAATAATIATLGALMHFGPQAVDAFITDPDKAGTAAKATLPSTKEVGQADITDTQTQPLDPKQFIAEAVPAGTSSTFTESGSAPIAWAGTIEKSGITYRTPPGSFPSNTTGSGDIMTSLPDAATAVTLDAARTQETGIATYAVNMAAGAWAMTNNFSSTTSNYSNEDVQNSLKIIDHDVTRADAKRLQGRVDNHPGVKLYNDYYIREAVSAQAPTIVSQSIAWLTNRLTEQAVSDGIVADAIKFEFVGAPTAPQTTFTDDMPTLPKPSDVFVFKGDASNYQITINQVP